MGFIQVLKGKTRTKSSPFAPLLTAWWTPLSTYVIPKEKFCSYQGEFSFHPQSLELTPVSYFLQL